MFSNNFFSISIPLAYQGVRNVSFSKNFAYVLNELSQTLQSAVKKVQPFFFIVMGLGMKGLETNFILARLCNILKTNVPII